MYYGRPLWRVGKSFMAKERGSAEAIGDGEPPIESFI